MIELGEGGEVLEIRSVVLGAISILQNVDRKKSLDDRIVALEKALCKIGDVYKCLEEAKEIHDQFDKFCNISLKSEIEGIRRNRDNRIIVLNHMRNIVNASDCLIRTRSVQVRIVDGGDFSEMPISGAAKKLVSIYPELGLSLHSYIETIEFLRHELGEENIGRKVEILMETLTSQVARVSSNADEVILNIVPVTQFLHYEVTRYVKGLK